MKRPHSKALAILLDTYVARVYSQREAFYDGDEEGVMCGRSVCYGGWKRSRKKYIIGLMMGFWHGSRFIFICIGRRARE